MPERASRRGGGRAFVRRHRVIVATLAAICLVGLVPASRAAVLSRVGGWLVVNDPLAQADVVVLTPESDLAGQLEIADLYLHGMARSVLVLDSAATQVDREFDRRGVHFPDLTLETLGQLGVPHSVVMRAEGGEGGTTENTQALATWIRRQPVRQVIVVVSPTHGRRYRRALLRVWPAGFPAPIIRTSHHGLFKANEWWRSRSTLREGLIEIEKLGLDYLRHPF